MFTTGGIVPGAATASKDEQCRMSTKMNFKLRVASQPFSSAAPWASISANLIRSIGGAGSSSDTRKENATGLEYPFEFCPIGKTTHCPQLAGLGVRAKRILGLKNINVYALGIYVDGTAAKRALGHKFKGDAAKLAADQALLDEVVKSESVDKSLRLVISFGHLKRQQFLEALEERLAPALNKAGEPATLDAFKAQFDGVTFSKGLEIVFSQHGSKLTTQIGGTKAGELHSRALNNALFDLYLGSDPVVPAAKQSCGSTLAGVLTGK